MRGSPSDATICMALYGIIPAHAGLTICNIILHTIMWDHPRACGAHMAVGTAVLLAQGSSPRMRGSRLIRPLVDIVIGIIPAHAGLTKLLFFKKFIA